MKKFVAFATFAAALSFSAVSAQANGWGWSGNTNVSSGGLVNVSPSVQTGSINVLNGGILNGAPILSGNAVLSGNNTGVGILGSGTGLLNNVVGNISSSTSRRK